MGREREDDRKRHRSQSHKSRRHKDDRHRKSSRRDDEKHSRHESHHDANNKLTEEEERLYETAKAFVQQQEGGKIDRHDEHKKRSRRDDHDSSTDDSRRKDHRKHKSDRHKSDRKEHKRKRSKRDDDRDKKKERRHHKDEQKSKGPSIDTSNLVSLGAIANEPPSEQLDLSLNYFSHNPHLRLYLYRTHGLYFEDLSSDQSRNYFTEFCEKYNSGKLEEAYYNAQLPPEAMDQCSRTKHQWKFRTNEIEEQKLNLVKAGVRKQTEYDANVSSDNPKVAAAKPGAGLPPPRKAQDEYDFEQSRLEKRAAQKQSDKRHRERINLANEEIYGVNTKPSSGWERQQMKRREQSDKTHGAYRDREDVMGGADLDDDAIYGTGEIGGGRSRELGFGEAVAKERARRERREAEMAQKVEEGKRKEEEKRKEMLAMLGLSGVDAGKKITIAPRRDGA